MFSALKSFIRTITFAVVTFVQIWINVALLPVSLPSSEFSIDIDVDLLNMIHPDDPVIQRGGEKIGVGIGAVAFFTSFFLISVPLWWSWALITGFVTGFFISVIKRNRSFSKAIVVDTVVISEEPRGDLKDTFQSDKDTSTQMDEVKPLDTNDLQEYKVTANEEGSDTSANTTIQTTEEKPLAERPSISKVFVNITPPKPAL